MSEGKLDNPVWHSLSETHRHLAIDFGMIKFYHPDFCPFGGFIDPHQTSAGISQYSSLEEKFFVVGEKPDASDDVVITRELVCLQMIMKRTPDLIRQSVVIKLDDSHLTRVYDLVNLVQPGYFKQKTALMGDYFGIFDGKNLVAVSGERMQMRHYTEVSAVVTHPAHTGKGYAGQLVAHGVHHILSQGKIPYLHVVESNTNAIRLYQKLGFETRRKISFWNLVSSTKQ